MSQGHWKRRERFAPRQEGATLMLPISAVRSLSMMVLCEEQEESHAVQQMELLVNEPWSLVT